jgi:hypothetical protein
MWPFVPREAPPPGHPVAQASAETDTGVAETSALRLRAAKIQTLKFREFSALEQRSDGGTLIPWIHALLPS